ncbi:hypothetical protein OJ996_17810 [Luteolibacter sp. GHJ8]|jgi:hypothetical protein|uniref:Uncharacterized protein n=1 Tax=Luteolibacter rhizosphaerae TaxID=2989719 RepID=A0ABT3G6H1_9BACT|nr:hypothetical protein [Luteolibacter rhizosphaerae]MCW1915446.1 hypothetical protein [Luteolibacter rhizosphaerae]
MSSAYMAQFWGFYSLAMSALLMACGIVFLRQRGGLAWALFISGLAGSLSALAPQFLMWGFAADWWGWGRGEEAHKQLMKAFQLGNFIGMASGFVFYVSLLLYALRGNGNTRRIAELEAILHERMSRNDAP